MRRKIKVFGRTASAFAVMMSLVYGSSAQAALVAEWKFDSIEGDNSLLDQVGHLNGVATGEIALIPSGAGVLGSTYDFSNAYSFVGNEPDATFVNLGTTAATHVISNFGTGPFSIAGWFKANERNINGNYRTIYSNIGASGGISINLGGNNASNRGRFQVQVGVGNEAVVFQSTSQYDRSSDHQWHWFAVTSDGATLCVYLDGVLMGTLPYLAGTTATPDAGSRAFIGRAFDGNIDQLTIWDQQLTAVTDGDSLTGGELYDLWRQGVPGSVSP